MAVTYGGGMSGCRVYVKVFIVHAKNRNNIW